MMNTTTRKPTGDPLIDPAALAYWWMRTYKPDGGKVSHRKYREMDSACYRLFKYVSKSMGYDPRTNQQWVHVKMLKDADVADALAELNLFLPYIEPSDGYKHIGIFEHTLSEDGMYELRQYAETDIRLIISRYGRESVLQRFNTWALALDYVKSNHWYDD